MDFNFIFRHVARILVQTFAKNADPQNAAFAQELLYYWLWILFVSGILVLIWKRVVYPILKATNYNFKIKKMEGDKYISNLWVNWILLVGIGPLIAWLIKGFLKISGLKFLIDRNKMDDRIDKLVEKKKDKENLLARAKQRGIVLSEKDLKSTKKKVKNEDGETEETDEEDMDALLDYLVSNKEKEAAASDTASAMTTPAPAAKPAAKAASNKPPMVPQPPQDEERYRVINGRRLKVGEPPGKGMVVYKKVNF